ncbi:hypothetical protein FB451DRAFT_1219876 [Mycena latifolia]|nr:hypothetical protein FB451DRAFT_1219876 [Mycena latifolia]
MSPLDVLPNELICEIALHLERDEDISRRDLHTFASFNRRIRQVALPTTFREIRVPNCQRIPSLFEVLTSHFFHIKSIRVGHPHVRRYLTSDFNARYMDMYLDPRLPSALQFSQLENLSSFHCLGFCFEPTELTTVFGASNSMLRSLRLGWDASRLFPFETFPSLEKLFIDVIVRRSCRIPHLLPRIFPSLLTLSIIDNMAWFVTKIWRRATFPNLRVFHLLTNNAADWRVLNFISNHPTLLEVDLPRALMDFPEFVRLAMDERDWTTQDLFWNDLKLAGFSFVRTARQQPENPADPASPHTLAELNLTTSPFENTFLLEHVGRLAEFPLFAPCSRLSLVICNIDDEDPNLQTLMSTTCILGETLAEFKNLQYFHLGARFSFRNAPPMRDDESLDCASYFEEWALWFGSQEADDLRQTAIDHGRECHDNACAMTLWKEEREEGMASWVRRLAMACRKLEVFELSMRGSDFEWTEFTTGSCTHPPLWRWDICRDPDGAILVSGRLTWNGYPNHPSHCLSKRFKT